MPTSHLYPDAATAAAALAAGAVHRRRLLGAMGACSLLGWPRTHGFAQSPQPAYPRKTVRLLAAYQPDDLPQLLARHLAKHLTERLRSAVVFDAAAGNNVAALMAQLLPGGGSAPGTSDGHTLLVGDLGLIALQGLVHHDPGYQPQRDLVPCALLGRVPLVLVVSAKVPANSLTEWLQWTRGAGVGGAMGTPGAATVSHFAAMALQAALWPDAKLLPAGGGAAATAALLRGETQALFASYASVAPLLAKQQVKVLASTALPSASLSATPPTLASLPDTQELALTGPLRLPRLFDASKTLNFYTHLGLFAPVFTPAAALDRLALELGILNTLPEPLAGLLALGIEPLHMGAGPFYKLAQAEGGRMAAIAKAAGIRPS